MRFQGTTAWNYNIRMHVDESYFIRSRPTEQSYHRTVEFFPSDGNEVIKDIKRKP